MFLSILKDSKCIKLYIFPENLKKIIDFTSKFKVGSGYPKHMYFLFDLR